MPDKGKGIWMGRVIDFLSGHTVYMALDRFFEKHLEPRYRRKAVETDCINQFEQELIVLRDLDMPHASQRAFIRARRLSRFDHS